MVLEQLAQRLAEPLHHARGRPEARRLCDADWAPVPLHVTLTCLPLSHVSGLPVLRRLSYPNCVELPSEPPSVELQQEFFDTIDRRRPVAPAAHGGEGRVGAASNAQGSGDGFAASDHDDLGMAEVIVDHFRSEDRDETQAFLGRMGHHIKVPYGGDRFAYELAGAASRNLTAVHIIVAVRQAVRAADTAPMLFLPLRTGHTFNIGRKSWQPDTTRAILVASGHEYSAHAPAGALLGLRVDGDLLCREISGQLRGRSRSLLLKSLEIPIDAGRLATLRAIYERMFAAAKVIHSWGAYGNVDTFETEVAAWVAGLVIEQAGAQAASAESLQRLDRLERWLDARLGENITLDQLCAESGLGWRALQKLMMARYGQSPLEWVHARRLAAVRARLLNGTPEVAISRVALDCGFTHLGRFSAAYRRAHGELPSETLAAARSQHRRRKGLPA